MFSLKKFLNETSLHGFGYVDEKNKFFFAFWAIATVTGVALAVNDIVALVQTYQSVPFQVTVTPQPNNDVSLPTPTLCMEIMVIPPTNIISPSTIESDIRTFLHKTGNAADHTFSNGVDMGLSENLEYLTYMMLSYISDSEMLFVHPHDQIYTDYATRYITGNQDIWSLTKIVFDIYAKYDVSLVDLKLLVGTSICQKQFKQAKKGKLITENLGPLQLCQPDTLTHLSFSLVCSSVLDTKTFNTGDFHTFSVGPTVSASDPDPMLKFPPVTMTQMCQPIPEALVGVISYVASSFPILQGTDGSPANLARFLWHWDLHRRPVLSADSLQDTITIDPQIPIQKFDVSLNTEFNFYDDPTFRHCVNEESQHQCRWRKVVERMSQNCGCWPSTIIGLSNDNQLPSCSSNPSLNPYMRNSNAQYNSSGRCDYGLETTIDDAECPKQCQSFFYTTSVVDAYRHVNLTTMRTPYRQSETSSGSFEVKFQVGTFRTVIKEVPTMSFTILACSFGGTIGTWLGGSILAFLHIPVFIMAQLHDHYAKRKIAAKADNSVSSIGKEIIYPTTSIEIKSL